MMFCICKVSNNYKILNGKKRVFRICKVSKQFKIWNSKKKGYSVSEKSPTNSNFEMVKKGYSVSEKSPNNSSFEICNKKDISYLKRVRSIKNFEIVKRDLWQTGVSARVRIHPKVSAMPAHSQSQFTICACTFTIIFEWRINQCTQKRPPARWQGDSL